jgi:hypothetical protein
VKNAVGSDVSSAESWRRLNDEVAVGVDGSANFPRKSGEPGLGGAEETKVFEVTGEIAFDGAAVIACFVGDEGEAGSLESVTDVDARSFVTTGCEKGGEVESGCCFAGLAAAASCCFAGLEAAAAEGLDAAAEIKTNYY